MERRPQSEKNKSKLKYLEFIVSFVIWGINNREYQQQDIFHGIGTLNNLAWPVLNVLIMGVLDGKIEEHQVVSVSRAHLQNWIKKIFPCP